jgi:glyoxylase I family protein
MNIEHVAWNVADPVAVAEWYTRHLGMRVVRAQETPPYTRFLADSAGRGVVEIYGHTLAPVPDYAAMNVFVLHLAFVSQDIQADMKRLLAAGATLANEPVVTPAGDHMAFLRDPWGFCVQLVKRARPLLEAEPRP